MRAALIKTEDNTIVRIIENIDPSVETKPGYRWLPCPFVERPTFFPELEIVEGPIFVVGATEVLETYTKRDLTPAELDLRKEQKLDAYDILSLKILFDHENRLRTLENKTAITAAQFRAALKARL